MAGFETSVVVRRSLEEVAAYLSDLQNDPQWRREWVDAEPVSAGPMVGNDHDERPPDVNPIGGAMTQPLRGE